MIVSTPDFTHRRALLGRMIGAGAALLAAPWMPRLLGISDHVLISSANAAAGYTGVFQNQGNPCSYSRRCCQDLHGGGVV